MNTLSPELRFVRGFVAASRLSVRIATPYVAARTLYGTAHRTGGQGEFWGYHVQALLERRGLAWSV